jgi:hypothetical protein
VTFKFRFNQENQTINKKTTPKQGGKAVLHKYSITLTGKLAHKKGKISLELIKEKISGGKRLLSAYALSKK